MRKGLLLILILINLVIIGCANTLPSTTTQNPTSSNTSGTDTQITSSPSEISYDSLFDATKYHKLTIYFSQANFDKLVLDMENYHDQFGSYRDNTIQQVDITYEDGDGNLAYYNEVGFRTKGNIFSRVLPVIKDNNGYVIGYQQVSFQLEFDETFSYAKDSTQWKALHDREIFDLEQLNFKRISPNDGGVVTELIGYQLYQEAGVITSNSSLCIVYFDIDGTVIPYGLYLVQEPIDSELVKRKFGLNQDGNIGDLYKCVWQTEPATLKDNYLSFSLGISDYMEGYRKTYQLKTNEELNQTSIEVNNFSSFKTFVDKLNNPLALDYDNFLSNQIDIDSLLRAFAIGFLIGSPDDYRSDANNYYLYFYEGKAVYIPFDMDQSLGFGWNPYSDYGISLDVIMPNVAQPYYIGSYTDLPLAYHILNQPLYQEIYLNYLLEFSNPETGIFQVSKYIDLFNTAKDLYEAEILLYNHLGVQNFSLDYRDMNPITYYSEKSASVLAQVEALLDE